MDDIETLLTRGVHTIYPSREALEKVLRSGKKLKVYQGFDPTGTQLHIGHAVGLRKLRQFQDLGHHVIFLIGDFTGMIGDPSGKKDARKPLIRTQVLANAQDYQDQASKILQFAGLNPVEIRFNSEWNSKLTFEDVLRLTTHFTAQQMIERDLFQARLKEGREISLVEFLYPVMQAYDAVAMNVDIELGGTDQTFNMLTGRKLVKEMLSKEKFVITVPLLTDAMGRKIGKTEGNVIGITDAPNEFYGKIMNLGDDSIMNCFTLLTDIALEEIKRIEQALAAGENPILFKKKLAFELTRQYNSAEAALAAQTYFEKTFQKRELSDSLPEFPLNQLSASVLPIVELLMETQTAASKSEARRLVIEGAVEIDQIIVDLVQTNVTLKTGMTLRVGKKRFVRFI